MEHLQDANVTPLSIYWFRAPLPPLLICQQQHKYYSLEEVTLSRATHFSFLWSPREHPACNQHLPSPDDLLLIRAKQLPRTPPFVPSPCQFQLQLQWVQMKRVAEVTCTEINQMLHKLISKETYVYLMCISVKIISMLFGVKLFFSFKEVYCFSQCRAKYRA